MKLSEGKKQQIRSERFEGEADTAVFHTALPRQDNGPIDYDFVRAHLGTLMEDLMPDLLQVFLEDGEMRIRQLAASLRQKDWRQISSTAHTLKGSSATLGMSTLSYLCQQLESAARDHDWHNVCLLAAQVGKEFEHIRTFLAVG